MKTVEQLQERVAALELELSNAQLYVQQAQRYRINRDRDMAREWAPTIRSIKSQLRAARAALRAALAASAGVERTAPCATG